MSLHEVVTREEWLTERRKLLDREKAFTRQREELAQARRSLPWVRVDKNYRFFTTEGERSLAELFDGCDQLLVYHFMFGPDWQEGCPSCSFWADNYDGTTPHLRARNIKLVVISRGPLQALQSYRQRMGWQFDWVSSQGSDFNFDYGVSFDRPSEDSADGAAGLQQTKNYNFGTQSANGEEAPGLSAFCRQGDDIYHTYSCYARGLDMLNGAYQHMDVAPLGRAEHDLPWPMAWVKRRDEYPEP